MNTSVSRALRVLELAAASERPRSLTELAREIGAPKSTVLNLLRTLVAHRFLDIDESGRYGLGVRAFEVGAAYLHGITPLEAARPEVVLLSRSLDLAAHFAVLDPPHALYLAKEDPTGPGVRLASALGGRLPAHLTAVGKAILAHAPSNVEEPVDLTIPDASGRRVSANELAAELERVRQRGFAVDDGATALAVRCVAAPVFDASAACCGAIGVSYLRHGGPSVTVVRPAVVAAAGRASERLGGRSAIEA